MQAKVYPKENFSIKAWAEEDRPREKLMVKGRHSLSDAELIAILLGSGSREESAVDLSRRMLSAMDNNLYELGKKSISELCKFKGIGPAKAITIAAAMELGRRRQMGQPIEKRQIKSSKDAFIELAPLVMDLPHEEFWILMMNRANRVIAKEQISTGGVAGTVVDAKIIFSKALTHLACGIILCHNHPSGNLKPSRADIEITKKLKLAGDALEVKVLDHLIIAEKGYFSFADEGKM